MSEKTRKDFKILKPCPLCKTMLEPGEKVRTKVFSPDSSSSPSMGIRDSLVHIYGCPYCDQRPAGSVIPFRGNTPPTRRCPSCNAALDAQDYVIARLFEQDSKKTHLHVIGCTRCRKYGRV